MRKATRVAALYDVHANLPALEAVLRELERVEPDLVVVGGDVAGGPLPRETLDRLMDVRERALFIRGNGDRELVEAAGDASDAWALRTLWVREQLTQAQLDFLAGFRDAVRVDVVGLGATLFCHGSPRSDEEIVTRVTSEERLRAILAGVGERVVVCGHTHVQFDRQVGGTRVVNAGSVGMPYENEPGAYWALLGPDVELRRTAYDLESAAERIRATDFPDAGEFASENVLAPPSAEEASEFFEKVATDAAKSG